MSFRNLSPQEMFARMAADHTPLCQFDATTPEEAVRWKSQTLPQVLATLGDSPARVEPNAELVAEWEHDGLVKQRWMIDVQKHIAAAVQVNRPADAAPDQPLPTILCCHGHAPRGKESVMGNDTAPELKDDATWHNADYGHQMAKAGFVTYSLDWIGFGERNDDLKPNLRSGRGSRDWCNLLYLHATMLGMTSLSINVSHGKAATDFVSTLPFVDPDRLGVMGLSGGGTMTLWMSLCDERFRASEIICYSDLWAHFGIRDLNYCGMQVAPGLYKLVDLPDLQGLLVPRPLLIDIGIHDTCFLVDTATACYKHVERIYQTAGAADMLELDLFTGPHAWGANKSEAFFRKHLVGSTT